MGIFTTQGKGIIFCQRCQQLHGVDYDCRKLKLVEPEILDLKTEQEISFVYPTLDRAVIAGVEFAPLVGGVEVRFVEEDKIFVLDNEEFREAIFLVLVGVKEKFYWPLLLAFFAALIFWLALGLLISGRF